LSSVTILPFSTVEAEQAAHIRAVLKSQGLLIVNEKLLNSF
jgi:tRNA(fMet)-specific endonuclease VapC